jgi:AAA family ATP:ADP antiporter
MYVLIPGTFLFFAVFVRLCAVFSQVAIFYILTSFFLVYFAGFAFIMYPMKDYLHPNSFCDWLLEVLPRSCLGPVAMIRLWTFSIFYLMAELWGSVIVSLSFWGFANQVCSVAEAKKFYALLVIIGNIAPIFSGGFVTHVAEKRQAMVSQAGYDVDPWEMTLNYLISACLISGACLIATFTYMQRYVVNDPDLVEQTTAEKKTKKSKSIVSLTESLRYIANSPYILDLGVLVIAYGLINNLIEVVWIARLKLQYPEANDYAAFLGKCSAATGYATIILTLIGHRFLAWFGWGVTAMCTPVVCLLTGGCFFSLILFPSMWEPVTARFDCTPLFLSVMVGAVQNVSMKGTTYGMFFPTKDMAFIPLDAEQKTKGKAAIDLIASRMGKAGGSFIQQVLILLLGSLSACTAYFGFFLLVATLAWIRAVGRLNLQFVEFTAKSKGTDIEIARTG